MAHGGAGEADEGVEVGPAFAVQGQADGAGLVAQEVAEVLAEGSEAFVHSGWGRVVHGATILKAVTGRRQGDRP